MPQMKAKVHLPLQHPMMSSWLSLEVHVEQKLPKISPSKSKSSQRAVWLASSPGRSTPFSGSEDRVPAPPLYSLELKGMKGNYLSL